MRFLITVSLSELRVVCFSFVFGISNSYSKREDHRIITPIMTIGGEMARSSVTKLIILVYCVAKITSAPISHAGPEVQYLSNNGYLPTTNHIAHRMISEETLSAAISGFQSFMGLDVTGKINSETSHMMSLPRCGVNDRNFQQAGHIRSKRYASFDGSRWNSTDLTYKISSYPRRPNKSIVDQEIENAFAVWSQYTDLTFTQKTGEADIDISFKSGSHKNADNTLCDDPFDGPVELGAGGILAHALSPKNKGETHFDSDEDWTLNGEEGGINLFQVAVHEFGHALGLDHSEVREATMFKRYRYQPDFKLDEDDIKGIQSIYGPKTTDEVPSICKDPKVDAIFKSVTGKIYVLKGKYIWRLLDNKIADGYPKLISKMLKGLPNNIDDAVTYNESTFFFKGSKYWEYKAGHGLMYPRAISDRFPGIPDDIDAAVYDSGKIYFFKDSNYRIYNPNQWQLATEDYSRSGSIFEYLSGSFDAAFSENGYLYVFQGNGYYQFLLKGHYYVEERISFDIGRDWFGCPKKRYPLLGAKNRPLSEY